MQNLGIHLNLAESEFAFTYVIHMHTTLCETKVSFALAHGGLS